MQIGPRIRIGGTLGHIGEEIKHGVADVGHAVGSVASNPLTKAAVAAALGLTGVGLPASAAIMGGIGFGGDILKPGGNIGGALKEGVLDGGLTYGAGKLMQGLGGFHPSSSGATGASGAMTAGGGALGDAAKEAAIGGAEQAGHSGLGGLIRDPKFLATIGGVAKGALDERNQSQNRQLQQQQIDMENRKYEDEKKRRDATAAAMGPYLARLLGQFQQPGSAPPAQQPMAPPNSGAQQAAMQRMGYG